MSKYTYDLTILTNEDALSYYLLGVFMTDGCISKNNSGKRVTLASNDLSWLETIRDLFCKEMPLRVRHKSNIHTLEMYNTEMADWFINKKCIPNKSLVLEFPEVPDKYLPDFIRGCIDGDGSINICQSYTVKKKTGKKYPYTAYTCYLCGSSNLFMNSFNDLLNENNYTHSMIELKKKPQQFNGRMITQKNPHYRISFGGSSCAKFLEWIYYPNHILSMPRKNEIAQNIITSFSAKSGT